MTLEHSVEIKAAAGDALVVYAGRLLDDASSLTLSQSDHSLSVSTTDGSVNCGTVSEAMLKRLKALRSVLIGRLVEKGTLSLREIPITVI